MFLAEGISLVDYYAGAVFIDFSATLLIRHQYLKTSRQITFFYTRMLLLGMRYYLLPRKDVIVQLQKINKRSLY